MHSVSILSIVLKTTTRSSTIKPFRNDRLTYQLNLVAQQAISLNDPIFIRETGCNLRELRVLRLICDSPDVTFASIAKYTGLERSLTSRIIQKLIAQGLIERHNSTKDARVFWLKPSEKGLEIRQIARNVSDQLEEILTKPLSAAEMETLQNYLARLDGWVNSDAYHDQLAAASDVMGHGSKS